MTPSEIRLVAVVVTHNRLADLQATLARLLAVPAAHLEAVIVVDNASHDGTEDWLARQDDARLVVHRIAANLGGAGGFELGLRQAFEQFDPDWAVVMDDDARPAEGALAAFHQRAPYPWDALAAAVYYPDGHICEMNRPSRNPFWHLGAFFKVALGGGRKGFHITDADYENAPRQIDVTSFVGFFISRAAVAACGYPDARLFLYGDDSIYTLKLSAAGMRIGFEPQLRFEHDCSTFSASQLQGPLRPLWKIYYYHRNLLILYRMAASWWFALVVCVIVPKWLLRLRHHKGERRIFWRLFSRALWDGLRGDTSRSFEQVKRLAGENSP